MFLIYCDLFFTYVYMPISMFKAETHTHMFLQTLACMCVCVCVCVFSSPSVFSSPIGGRQGRKGHLVLKKASPVWTVCD